MRGEVSQRGEEKGGEEMLGVGRRGEVGERRAGQRRRDAEEGERKGQARESGGEERRY